MYSHEAQQELNSQHLANPQAGDYWHERFSPYFVILHTVGDVVYICKTRISLDDSHWTWNTDVFEMQSLAWLKERVCYNSIPGFVADVVPARCLEHAEEWFMKQMGQANLAVVE